MIQILKCLNRYSPEMCYFSLSTFIFGFQHFRYDVSRCNFFHVYLLWGSLKLFNLLIYVFHPNLEKFSSVISSNIFSAPFYPLLLGLPKHVYLTFLYCPTDSLDFVTFWSFFLFFTLDNFYWFISKFIDSSLS